MKLTKKHFRQMRCHIMSHEANIAEQALNFRLFHLILCELIPSPEVHSKLLSQKLSIHVKD